MKIFALCIILLSSLLLTPALPEIVSFCGWDYESPDIEQSTLFKPQLSKGAGFSPLYYSFHKYYDESWSMASDGQAENIAEWKEYFHGALDSADLMRLLYMSDSSSIPLLPGKRNGRSPNAVTDADLRLFLYFKMHPDPDFLAYLLFAKRCEPYVSMSTAWMPDEEVAQRKAALALLYKESRTLASRTASPFLKHRYDFQCIRLAHYTGNNEDCIALYDQRIAPLKNKDRLSYWALEHKAGALLEAGRTAEAMYLFTRVIAECPSRRESSILSFDITSDSLWKRTDALCRTPEEHALLYFIRGFGPYNDGSAELEHIYAVAPSSIFLNILFTREINIIEGDLFDDIHLRLNPVGNVPTDSIFLRHLLTLRLFAQRCVKEGKASNRDFWVLSSGYLAFLAGDLPPAAQAYASLKKTTDTTISKLLPSFETALAIASMRRTDAGTMNGLFSRISEPWQSPLLYRYLVSSAEKRYRADHDTVMAFLCYHSLGELHRGTDTLFLEQLIAREQRVGNDAFQRFLFDMHDCSRKELLDLKATMLMRHDRFPEAIALLREIGEDMHTTQADPFTARIKDNRDRDFADTTQAQYSKLTLAERILALEKTIRTDKETARTHLLLGNAFYNMSYFGNSTEILFYDRNPDDISYRNDALTSNGVILPPYDCSRARMEYERGMELAEQQGDKELAAECCFMAAKCEQNEYYVSASPSEDRDDYRTFFDTMKERFSSSKFYAKALDECMYFKNYVRRH